jgi:hypothetical protein
MSIKLYKPFYDPNLTPNNKKYSVYVKSDRGNSKLIHFGAVGYQQYKDRVPGQRYKSYDHLDKKRRARYRKRHATDNIHDKNSAGYWAWNYLW